MLLTHQKSSGAGWTAAVDNSTNLWLEPPTNTHDNKDTLVATYWETVELEKWDAQDNEQSPEHREDRDRRQQNEGDKAARTPVDIIAKPFFGWKEDVNIGRKSQCDRDEGEESQEDRDGNVAGLDPLADGCEKGEDLLTEEVEPLHQELQGGRCCCGNGGGAVVVDVEHAV